MDPDGSFWFIHSTSIYYVPSTVAGPGHRQELDMVLVLERLMVWGWRNRWISRLPIIEHVQSSRNKNTEQRGWSS